MTMNALRGGRMTAAQVATDAFGNALGNSILGGMQGPDQSDAETARLARQNEAGGFAGWPDQTDAESARLARSMYQPDQSAADVAARGAGASGRQLDELLAAVGSDGVSVDTRPGSVYVQPGDSLSEIAARFPEYGDA